MGKLNFKICLVSAVLLLGTLFLILFFNTQTAYASSGNVVINEVMANPITSTTGEFIELYNDGAEIDLSKWYFKDNISKDTFIIFTKKSFGQSDDFKLKANSYALILDPDYINDYDDFLTKHFHSGDLILTVANTALGNGLGDNDEVTLYNEKDEIIDKVILSGSAGSNHSWERKTFSSSQFLISRELGGTPGAENSVTNILPPEKPDLILPEQNKIFTGNISQVDFSWKGANTTSYTFLLGRDKELKDTVSEEELKTTSFIVKNLSPGIYYWQVVANNEASDTASAVFQFEILTPVYSQNIIINELMPDPVGDETTGEWIELFNNSNEDIDLNDWQLTDRSGTIKKFTIENTTISANSYLCFSREDTGITLNNTKDGASLFQPNGLLLMKTPQFSDDGAEGWAWARGSSGQWAWTTKPTKCYANKIRAPDPEEEVISSEEMATINLNQDPIPIQTGNYSSYSQQLVRILGKVAETSGSTFYLDDGSGRAKVYIQTKTNIKKPPMHKGDTFAVTGIVNLFRQVWRILPQRQDHVQLISLASDSLPFSETETETKKTTTKKTVAPIAAIKPSPQLDLIKEVKAAETQKINPIPKEATNEGKSVLPQIAKLITGLALIFLVILIIKVMKHPKPIVIGGRFGRDDT